MEQKEIREALEKQLQLLSERSKDCYKEYELATLTHAMVKVAKVLCSFL